MKKTKKFKKKVRNVDTSKREGKVEVGPKKEKLFGQADQLPKTTPKKPFNKLKFEKARKSVFGMK